MSERVRCDRFYREGGLEEGGCLEEHLSTCPDCAEDRRKQSWVIELLGKMDPEDIEAPPSPLPGWEERLLARLDREFPSEESNDSINVGLQDWIDLPEAEDRITELEMEEVQEQTEATICVEGSTWLREQLRTSWESEALDRTLTDLVRSAWMLAVMPDGRSGLSPTHDAMIEVWEHASGREICMLPAVGGWVTGVAVTPDGRFAVSSSSDNTLKVWELASGCAIHTLEGRTEPVKEAAVTPDGRLAAPALANCLIEVLLLLMARANHTPMGRTSTVTRVVVKPNGRPAVSTSEDTTKASSPEFVAGVR